MIKLIKKIFSKLKISVNKIIGLYLKKIIWKSNILDLNDLFRELKQYEYFIVKVDTPYTPKDFPNSIPIGKDMDIFSSKGDFSKVNKVLLEFAKKYQYKFKIRIIDENGKYRVRLENLGQLYYQLDNNILSVFIEEIIQNKIYKNGYYTIPRRYEIVFRLSEIKSYPHKKHHIEYIRKNLENINESIIPAGLIEILEQIKKGTI